MAACLDDHNSNSMHDFNDRNNSGGMKGSNDEDRKLFLGGLSWDSNEDDIRQYFSKYGTVLDVSIKYDAVTGNPRGFGFITFAEDDAVDKVLSNVPHTIKNKTIDPKRAKSRPICKKIFVGGVDANISEEEIKKYFSKYGAVEGIELPFDKQRGRRREFCFIIFDTEEGADAACKDPKQTIGGRECDIKKAQPQPVAQQQKRMQQASQAAGYSNQYASSGYGYSEDGSWTGDGSGDNRKRRGGNSANADVNQSNWGGYGNGSAAAAAAGYYGNQYYSQGYYPYNQGYADYYGQYGYGYDYWNYQGYGYGDGSTAPADYSQGTGSGESNYTGAGGGGGGGSGQSSQSSSHSHHHGASSGKVTSRKTAPSSSNYHPYRSSSSH